MSGRIHVDENRKARKYSARELFLRSLWAVVGLAFRLTPRPLHGLRRVLLSCMGARLGRNVVISPRVRIFAPWQLEIGDWSAIGDSVLLYNLGPITLGQRVTISQNAHLCAGTHDFRDPTMKLLKPPIRVGDDAWICADAFVGPGVQIGVGAVVGARAVVVRDVSPWVVVAGNPAREVGRRELRGE